MTMLAWIRQTVSVAAFNVASIPQRLGQSAVAVVGIAGVVTVFIGVLSIGAGVRATLAGTGDPRHVIVVRAGADAEMTSGLSLETTRIVADGPGVARDAAGPVASSELFVIADLPIRATGTGANVPFRGVGARAFDVRPEVEIVEGRRFEPGRNEMIVGRRAAGEFAGLEVGNSLQLGTNRWDVVGMFEAGGGVEETELWTDVNVLQAAYRRGSSFQSLHLRLEPAVEAGGARDRLVALRDALSADPRVDVKLETAHEFYSSQGEVLKRMIFTLGFVIAGLMGVGAVFAALNTMYSAVSARTREIATLRALGFGAGPVIVSVMLEALALAFLGGVVGAVVAYLVFNGQQAATLNWQTFTQIAFAFAVTPPLMVGGLVYALAMGVVGGFFPAIRAARLPVAAALRQT